MLAPHYSTYQTFWSVWPKRWKRWPECGSGFPFKNWHPNCWTYCTPLEWFLSQINLSRLKLFLGWNVTFMISCSFPLRMMISTYLIVTAHQRDQNQPSLSLWTAESERATFGVPGPDSSRRLNKSQGKLPFFKTVVDSKRYIYGLQDMISSELVQKVFCLHVSPEAILSAWDSGDAMTIQAKTNLYGTWISSPLGKMGMPGCCPRFPVPWFHLKISMKQVGGRPRWFEEGKNNFFFYCLEILR